MAVEGSGAAREAPAMTSLPSVEELPIAERGFDEQAVREAFEAFRRHAGQLQAQLRVLQAAGRSGQSVPTGEAVRMDALHLIRGAAEFADVLERDAQRASAAQIQRTEQEVRQKQVDLQQREAEIQRHREESDRQRDEIVTAARNEARQLVAEANRDATKELREAEARGTRLLEQARHQATELTNATRAEVEQTLEWARAQAATIIARAQQGTEQLLGAAGLGEAAATEVAEAIVKSAEQAANASRAGEPESRTPAGGEVSPASQPLRSAPAPATPAPAQPQPSESPPPASPPPTPEQTQQPPSGSDDTNS
jgi:F0F1-type ATP synthase membrane subunit b/b'